jgi:hypothetical protein
VLGGLLGSFLYGTREVFVENPIRNWTADSWRQMLLNRIMGAPISGVAGLRMDLKGVTAGEGFWVLLVGYRLLSRPWTIALHLVLADQLLSLAQRHQWGVRLWHMSYRALPEQAKQLEQLLELPPPPPVDPADEAEATEKPK